MSVDCSDEAREFYDRAVLGSLIEEWGRRPDSELGRSDIESLIPHRYPFLFLDRITLLDRETSTVLARYDITGSAELVAGHFPGHAVWPAVLQVEAISQAGLCAAYLSGLLAVAGDRARLPVVTHILGSRFMRPIDPSGEVEIVARALSDGLFTVLVGQCLQADRVCSAAAVRGLNQEISA